MRFIDRNIISAVFATIAISVMGVGCSTEDADSSSSSTSSASGVYLSLSMSAASDAGTRSNPNGGDEGDGSEAGINNENTIHDITLFFYKNTDANSIESANTSTALVSTYVNDAAVINQSSTSWHTEAFAVNGLSLNVSYHVVVVANGDYSTLKTITTLGQLQDYITTKAWAEGATIADYDNFVRTSSFNTASNDKTFMVTSSNGKNSPVSISVSLKRLAARVDIIPYSSTSGCSSYNTTDKYYEFKVGSTSDKVRLTNIKLLNKMNAGCYLLKHIAAANGTDIATTNNLIGAETPTSGNETNYVVDPYTRKKTLAATTIDAKDINSFYDNYFSTTATYNNWSEDAVSNCAQDASYILGYTMENTMAQDCQRRKYTTSLCLKTTYVPASYYVINGSGNLELSTAVTAGQTFYRFGGQLYGTAAALAKAVNTAKGTTYDETSILTYTGMDTYTDGVCYYNYNIRHSNNNDDYTSAIMEFAIVRNNIYRITINSFSGLGTPTPKTTDDNDEKNSFGVTVHVLPWSIYQHSTIYL